MLEKGAQLNTTVNSGETALSLACDRGFVKIAKLLIEKGAI